MKKRRNRSVAVGLIALFVSVAMFAVTILARYAFQNTEQYSVGWIKYFTYFPNSLVALIPIGLLVIAFFVILKEQESFFMSLICQEVKCGILMKTIKRLIKNLKNSIRN